MSQDLEQDTLNKRRGFISGWSEKRKQRLDKIKKSKERPAALTMEELAERPSFKEIKMRKMVMRSETIEKEASKDDYI
jgi:hypothetical protein